MALVLLAGAVLGTGVSGYADVPAEDCIDLGAQQWAPIGTECLATSVGGGFHIGPTIGAWIGWMVAMCVLVGLALLRRESLVLRGAVAGAALLACCGFAAHALPEIFVVSFVAMVVGAPVVFATFCLLMPRLEQPTSPPWLVTFLVTPTTFFVATFFQFGGQGHLGVALALVTAAGVTRWGESWMRATLELPPNELHGNSPG